MTLHPITGKNSYCGPAAIAAVTGITTDQAAEVARMISGRSVIKAMSMRLLQQTLAELGVELEPRTVGMKRPTFKQWLRNHQNGTYVVLLTGHFVTVSGGKLVDNNYAGPIDATRTRYNRKRVRSFVRIVTTNHRRAQARIDELKRDRHNKRRRDIKMRTAVIQAAKSYGLTVNTYREWGYFTIEIFGDAYGREVSVIASDWTEAARELESWLNASIVN